MGAKRWWLVVAAVVCASAGAADEESAACAAVAANMAALSSDLRTSCAVTGMNGQAPAALLLVADRPHSRSDRSWRAYMLMACIAVGQRLNSRPALRINEVWMTDAQLLAGSQAYAVKASKCKAWQAQVHAGTVDLQAVADQVLAQAVRVQARR